MKQKRNSGRDSQPRPISFWEAGMHFCTTHLHERCLPHSHESPCARAKGPWVVMGMHWTGLPGGTKHGQKCPKIAQSCVRPWFGTFCSFLTVCHVSLTILGAWMKHAVLEPSIIAKEINLVGPLWFPLSKVSISWVVALKVLVSSAQRTRCPCLSLSKGWVFVKAFFFCWRSKRNLSPEMARNKLERTWMHQNRESLRLWWRSLPLRIELKAPRWAISLWSKIACGRRAFLRWKSANKNVPAAEILCDTLSAVKNH